MRHSPLTPLLLLTALVSCRAPEIAPGAPEAAVLQQLKRLSTALEASEVQPVLAFFHPEAKVMDSKGLLVAQGTILQALGRGKFRILEGTLRAHATTREGDLVRQIGRIEHQVAGKGGQALMAVARFEALWGQDADGVWRIRRWETAVD